jgi:hypothetical protein
VLYPAELRDQPVFDLAAQSGLFKLSAEGLFAIAGQYGPAR